MVRKNYSAGMVKLSFWFLEFKKMVTLVNSGMEFDEIKKLNLESNIFAAPTQARAIQMYNTISMRLKALDRSFYNLFDQLDVSNQKLLVLISIMASDTLFFDFMYEVFREKLIIGMNEIADRDVNVFFKDKQSQNDRVAKWTDYTLKRLGDCYKTLLMEAGVLNKTTGQREIIRPLIDRSLESNLKKQNMDLYISIFQGIR
jgi:3'-phosphoadenosine 5'-phosphosulfate sulfotransferase (PAPS reductase)/FAD synthetase